MEKQPVKRHASIEDNVGLAPVYEKGRDILFCVNPTEEGGPIIKPGQKVTYELMLGPDGQYYALNLHIVSGDE